MLRAFKWSIVEIDLAKYEEEEQEEQMWTKNDIQSQGRKKWYKVVLHCTNNDSQAYDTLQSWIEPQLYHFSMFYLLICFSRCALVSSIVVDWVHFFSIFFFLFFLRFVVALLFYASLIIMGFSQKLNILHCFFFPHCNFASMT